MYNIIADLHTHSLASCHAYSTIGEMVNAAKEKGFKALAITDHTKLMPGAPVSSYFAGLGDFPVMYRGIKLITGCELNIVDFEGNFDVDITRGHYKNLDWYVASIHEIPGIQLDDPTVEKCTELWLKIAQNPKINVIAHSGSPKFAYDYEKVIPEFGRNHKLVEINAHSFDVRGDNIPNCRIIAETCKKYGVPIIVSSDAHCDVWVGHHGKALKMLEEIDFPEELIVNASMERLNEYLEKYSGIKNRKFQ